MASAAISKNLPTAGIMSQLVIGLVLVAGELVSLLSDFIARKKIDQIGLELANQFMKRFPAARAGDRKRLATEIEITLGHARGLVRSENLGTLGRSRLANSFQWALIEAGYDKALALELGRDLAIRLSERRTEPT
jgi:hypothetical protein